MKKFNLFTILTLSLMLLCSSHSALHAEEFIDENTFPNEDIFNAPDNWEADEDVMLVNDPFKKFNSVMFTVNNKLIDYIFGPLSQGYDFIIPKPVQKCVNNLFLNLATPKRFFNNIFQKKAKNAGIEAGRFIINSTIGLGGFFDPAKAAFKLERKTEDLGQTFGYYGMGEGFYLVLPLLGPTTGRDLLGNVGDAVFSPFTWLSYTDVDPEDAWKAAGYVRRMNNFAYNIRDNYERLINDAFDPYTAIQHAYVQNRRKNIAE